MREHVCARCGDYLLLFPAENIEAIEPVLGQRHFGRWTERKRPHGGEHAAEAVLDLRRLLDVRAPASADDGVILRWRATRGPRQACLLVDNVEAIVNCYAGDLVDVAILPRRLRPLCEQVMHDPSGRLRLRVKPDVQLPFERAGDRRRYVRALLAAEPEPEPGSSR
jgi:hypothetical protein